MITDKDIEKMKRVFATKDDLKTMEAKMATKEDLKRFATKNDLSEMSDKFETKFATKQDIRKSTNELIELITIGFDRMDKAIGKLTEHDIVINNHELRIDRIEDKVFV